MKQEALKYMKDNSSDTNLKMFNTKKCTWIYLVQYLVRFGEQLKESNSISNINDMTDDEIIKFLKWDRGLVIERL